MSVVYNPGMSKPEVQPRQPYNLDTNQINQGFGNSKERISRIKSKGDEALIVQIAKEYEQLQGLAAQMHNEIKTLQGENKILGDKLTKLDPTWNKTPPKAPEAPKKK